MITPAQSFHQFSPCQRHVLLTLACAAVLLSAGCRGRLGITHPDDPLPLGSASDQLFRQQEDNAEAAKFVIYAHEFELNKPEWEIRLKRPYNGRPRGFRLSPNGEDHVRQIASLIREGRHQPVIVERSQTSTLASTEHKYPVHYNDELDLQRRDMVVQALKMFGIVDAESRVLVAPAFSEGLDAPSAARAYAFSRSFRTGAGRGSGRGGSGTGGF